MTAAFGTRPKRRLNRVLDAIGFEYPDYERLDKGAEGQKRKRVASILTKDDEDQPHKKKEKLEPKVIAPRKRKAASPKPASPKASSPEPEILARVEEVSVAPFAAEVEEILKIMTESLPVKLSLLAPKLTKFFQKDKETSVVESPAKPKKRRIIQVTDVIHGTPSPTSVSKIVVAKTAETAKGAATKTTRVETPEAETGEAETAGAEAGATEDPNLEDTLEVIDNILLKMAEEEASAVVASAATEKEKKQVEDVLEEGDFKFQDLLGQELTDAEKEELKKYAVSCGYKPGAMLFGGVNEGKLRCLRNAARLKLLKPTREALACRS
jgi:hypothetical protein